jgi:TonB-dependent receptor
MRQFSLSSLRISMLVGSALVLCAGHGVASAQAAMETVDEAIVVTGFRAQNRLAIEAKRSSDIIAEFLKSDDIGQQPDYNIADSLRRVPGVQTIFDEDEGRYVSIRGLNPSFTIGSLDGATMATAERGNRQLNMEAIPSTAVASLEVLKSRTPDMEGNAIGGAINLVTRSAFDRPGTFLIGNAFIGTSDSQDVPGLGLGRSSDDGLNFRADATLSTRFGPDDNFGIMVTGSFSRKRRDQERLLPQAVPLTTGETAAPAGPNSNLLWSNYPNSVDRYGGTVKLEARPAPGLEGSIAYTYFQQDDNELRHSQQLLNTAGGSFVRFNDFPLRKPLHVVNGKLAYDTSDSHHFGVRGSYSQATFLEPSNQLRFNLVGAAPGFDLRREGSSVFVSNVDPRLENPAEYRFALYDPYEDDSTDKVTEGQFDYGWNNQSGEQGFGVGAGFKYRKTERDNQRTQDIFGPAPGVDLRLTAFNQPETYQPIFSDFNQTFIDFEAFRAYFDANPGQFVRNNVNSERQNIGGDWLFREEVTAGYGLVRHAGERHTIIVGARYEKTETAATSVSRAVVGGVDVFTPITRTNDYDDFLPSITGLYDFTDSLRLRAAWFKGVGRPNPNSVSGPEVINADDSISRPNFALQPRRADSYEASLEYYMPDNMGIVALAVFHKTISNEIYTFSSIETIDGVERNVSQPRNAEDAKVTGFEANVIVNKFGFLPGFLSNFGASGNITLLDGSITIRDNNTRRPLDRLPGQARFLANAALFYEQGPVRARLSYAYVGPHFTSVNASNPAADRTNAATNNFDFQARIRATEQIEIIGEVRNLTNQRSLNLTGPNQDITRDVSYFGRQFWIGAAFAL